MLRIQPQLLSYQLFVFLLHEEQHFAIQTFNCQFPLQPYPALPLKLAHTHTWTSLACILWKNKLFPELSM